MLKGIFTLALACALAACSREQSTAPQPVAAAAPAPATAITYIKCKFEGPGPHTGIEMNYYLDHQAKQLLNDNKAPIGATQAWDEDLIQVASPREGKPAYVTRINRKTGQMITFPESSGTPPVEAFGTCEKAPLPTQKF